LEPYEAKCSSPAITKNLEISALLPGVRVNTSLAYHHPLRQMQLERWEGQGYVRFGNIIEGADL